MHHRLKENILYVLLLIMPLMAVSCSSTDYYYDQQCDVDVTGWSITDTLWYNVEVLDEPTLSRPLVAGNAYQIELSVRHLTSYPYHQLPLSMAVQVIDTVGGVHPVPVMENDSMRQWTYCNYRILPTLSDNSQHWRGYTTGSLCQISYHATPAIITFPHPGHYRLSLVHQTPDSVLRGVMSLGISLY